MIDLLHRLTGPNGATDNMLRRVGFLNSQINRAIRCGYVRARIVTMANPRGLVVRYCYLTDLGRQRVNESDRK